MPLIPGPKLNGRRKLKQQLQPVYVFDANRTKSTTKWLVSLFIQKILR